MIKTSLWLLCAILAVGDAMANGYVTVNPPKEFIYKLDNTSLTNKAGSVLVKDWLQTSDYSGEITCPIASIPPSEHFFTARYRDGRSADATGWVKLNDYLDMKVEIYIAGNRRQHMTVPFTNVGNATSPYSCRRGEVTHAKGYFASGGQGRLSIRVRKPIINGVKLSEHVEVELFGRLGNTVQTVGPTPMARVILDLGLLAVPEKCAVNGGQMIQVEFGDLPQQGLDGDRFAKQTPLTVRCFGGEFDQTRPFRINMALSGKGASFSNSDLRTTRDKYQGSNISPDLAIRFKQLNGQPLPLNHFVPVSLPGGSGDWGFIAAPLQRGGSVVATGDFYATATIVAELP